jgi:hypothetical protein
VGIGSWAYAVREREETGAGDRALTEAITKIAAAMKFGPLGTAVAVWALVLGPMQFVSGKQYERVS